MLRDTTAIRHLSYEEMDTSLRDLAERVRSQIQIDSLAPTDDQSTIACALLCNFIGIPMDMNSTNKFAIYSDRQPEVCMFKKKYETEHYNNRRMVFLEEVEVDTQGHFTRVTFPWKK